MQFKPLENTPSGSYLTKNYKNYSHREIKKVEKRLSENIQVVLPKIWMVKLEKANGNQSFLKKNESKSPTRSKSNSPNRKMRNAINTKTISSNSPHESLKKKKIKTLRPSE